MDREKQIALYQKERAEGKEVRFQSNIEVDHAKELAEIEKDPWFPVSITEEIRVRVLQDFVNYLYNHVFLAQVKRNEERRRDWVAEERMRQSLEMARQLIKSDNQDFMQAYGDETLLARCPHNWHPFLVHTVKVWSHP
jgi:hypothetical protein